MEKVTRYQRWIFSTFVFPRANSGHMGLLLQVVIVSNNGLSSGYTWTVIQKKLNNSALAWAQHNMFTSVPHRSYDSTIPLLTIMNEFLTSTMLIIMSSSDCSCIMGHERAYSMPLGYYARIHSILGKYTDQKDRGRWREKTVVTNGLIHIYIISYKR